MAEIERGFERAGFDNIAIVKATAPLIATAALAVALAGCSQQEQIRVPDPDAGGPIVNPRAPGAQVRGSGAAATQEYTAPPGTKTGIPK